MFKSSNAVYTERSVNQAVVSTFCRSLNSFLAKTINAFVTAAKNDLKIDLQIQISDKLTHLNSGHPCSLYTTYTAPIPKSVRASLPRSFALSVPHRPKITATIYIHPKCSRSLVKFGVAHELYHLYSDLCHFCLHKDNKDPQEEWVEGEWAPPRQSASTIRTEEESNLEEMYSNYFATSLSKHIHMLNANYGLRSRFKLYPFHIVDRPARPTIDSIPRNDTFNTNDGNDSFSRILSYEEVTRFRGVLKCKPHRQRNCRGTGVACGACDKECCNVEACTSKNNCQFYNYYLL